MSSTSLYYYFFLIFLTFPSLALADVSASYLYSPQTSSDKGSEILRRDASFNASHQFIKSSDNKHSYGAGIAILDSRFDFDDSRLGKVDLLKIKIPLLGTNLLNDTTIISWNITPGLHGSKDEFSKSKLRFEGQAMAIYPKENLKYAFGLAFNDSFGKVAPFPLIGVIWQASKQHEVMALFPMFKYEYTTHSEKKYNFSVQPDGAQWNWRARQVGNQQPVNVAISGYKFSVGANYKLHDLGRVFVNTGLVVNRKFTVNNENNSSREGHYNLRNAWIFEGGLTF